jgi:hypothetical protein
LSTLHITHLIHGTETLASVEENHRIEYSQNCPKRLANRSPIQSLHMPLHLETAP